MKNIIVLNLSLVLTLFSCTKQGLELNKLDNSKKYNSSIKKTRGLGSGFMGVYYDPYLNLGFRNSIASINTINGSLNSLPLIEYGLGYCPLYDNFKTLGISYMPVKNIKVKGGGLKDNISADFDLVIIAERIININQECILENLLIFANSLTGYFVYGPEISNGFKHCEYDFTKGKLLAVKQSSHEYRSIDILTGIDNYVNVNPNGPGTNGDGIRKGIYINEDPTRYSIGYFYSEDISLSNPKPSENYHFVTEIYPLDNFFWSGSNGNAQTSPFPFISTEPYANGATVTNPEDFAIANNRSSVEVYGNNGYISYFNEDGIPKLGKFWGSATTNPSFVIFENEHILNDMTDH